MITFTWSVKGEGRNLNSQEVRKLLMIRILGRWGVYQILCYRFFRRRGRFKRAKICGYAEKGLKMDLNQPKIVFCGQITHNFGGKELRKRGRRGIYWEYHGRLLIKICHQVPKVPFFYQIRPLHSIRRFHFYLEYQEIISGSWSASQLGQWKKRKLCRLISLDMTSPQFWQQCFFLRMPLSCKNFLAESPSQTWDWRQKVVHFHQTLNYILLYISKKIIWSSKKSDSKTMATWVQNVFFALQEQP